MLKGFYRSCDSGWIHTKAVYHYKSRFMLPWWCQITIKSHEICTYKSVILENRDVCNVNDWVLVQSDAANLVVCCIKEILSPLSSDSHAPQFASTILLQNTTIMGITDMYCMPRIHLKQDDFFLQPLAVGT